jgi:heme A synthase
MGLYLFQGLLGALTVVLRPANPPWATTWHLFNAILLLVVLVVATCHAYLVKQAAPVHIRKFSFTPSVHAARGYTYPDGRKAGPKEPAPEPQGPFPGETEERHG